MHKTLSLPREATECSIGYSHSMQLVSKQLSRRARHMQVVSEEVFPCKYDVGLTKPAAQYSVW